MAGKLRLRLVGGRGHDLKTAELTLALTVMGRDTPVTLPVEHCVGLDQAL